MKHYELEDETERFYTMCHIYNTKYFDFKRCLDKVDKAFQDVERELRWIAKGGPLCFEHTLILEANESFLSECEIMEKFLKQRWQNIAKMHDYLSEEEYNETRPTYHFVENESTSEDD